jgi:hypothetical protein
MKRSVVYKNEPGNTPPSAFNLQSPADGSQQKTVLLLSWSKSSDSDGLSYTLLISRNPKPTSANSDYVREEIPLSMAAIGPEAGLKDLTTYYWKVLAVDGYGARRSSDVRSFRTNNTNPELPGFIEGIVTDNISGAAVKTPTITTTSGIVKIKGSFYKVYGTPGDVTLTVSAPGYAQSTITTTIKSGDSVTLNIALSDNAAPQTTITSGASNPTTSKTAKFYFKASEAGSTFRCKLDNGIFGVCTSPRTYNNLTEGEHVFRVKATDASGNNDTTPAIYTWTIDLTPPDKPVVSGTTPTTDTTPTWTWSSGGGGSGTFRRKLNNSDFTTGATITTATAFTPSTARAIGSHTLYVQERDAAGNWSATGSFAIAIQSAGLAATGGAYPVAGHRGVRYGTTEAGAYAEIIEGGYDGGILLEACGNEVVVALKKPEEMSAEKLGGGYTVIQYTDDGKGLSTAFYDFVFDGSGEAAVDEPASNFATAIPYSVDADGKLMMEGMTGQVAADGQVMVLTDGLMSLLIGIKRGSSATVETLSGEYREVDMATGRVSSGAVIFDGTGIWFGPDGSGAYSVRQDGHLSAFGVTGAVAADGSFAALAPDSQNSSGIRLFVRGPLK